MTLIILIGKIIHVPETFKEELPSYHLDGELWYVENEWEEEIMKRNKKKLINSRGGYEDGDRMNILLKSNCGIKKGKMSIDWDQYKFCVFGM